MYYNFPPIKNYKDIKPSEQLKKIKEELREVEKAQTTVQKLIEAIDLLHAVETLIRILEQRCTGTILSLDVLKDCVIKKNKERGYYDMA